MQVQREKKKQLSVQSRVRRLNLTPESKLAVLSLSASMALALKSARRPRKNEKKNGLSVSKYSHPEN